MARGHRVTDSPDGHRTPVEYAVRLNDNGEFVHAAPWSVAQPGRENVSHGCINLSTERAAWCFDFSQPGDVVEIENSIGPHSLGRGRRHLRLGRLVGGLAGRPRADVSHRGAAFPAR
ncbi:L,D-transpeptidase [Blastococcus capsensis]|nr:L,D-transpeptidase [Blastococcus capsensis]MDK3258888.1 L,D-transpeptidase [Blastococcus capsensis]